MVSIVCLLIGLNFFLFLSFFLLCVCVCVCAQETYLMGLLKVWAEEGLPGIVQTDQ
jgi:hypothetical protein